MMIPTTSGPVEVLDEQFFDTVMLEPDSRGLAIASFVWSRGDPKKIASIKKWHREGESAESDSCKYGLRTMARFWWLSGYDGL